MDHFECADCGFLTTAPEFLYCDEYYYCKFHIPVCLECYCKKDRERLIRQHNEDNHGPVDLVEND